MKFKEMSWEELERDFKAKLAQYTIEELVDSLDKYKVEIEEYTLEKKKVDDSAKEIKEIIDNIDLDEVSKNTNSKIKYSNINNINEEENTIWKNNQELLVA